MNRHGLFLRYFYITGKRSGVDSKCAICIWKLLLWTHIMQSKELSIQVKQTIVRLPKQYKSIREIAGSGQINSLVHSEKKERTGELSNIKSPGCPRRTTVVDDQIILFMGKKNPFTTSSQVKNTLQEVDVSLSKSTFKRRLHERKYRGFTTRCKQGQIRLCLSITSAVWSTSRLSTRAVTFHALHVTLGRYHQGSRC